MSEGYIRMKLPSVVLEEAQERFLSDIRGSKLYEIVLDCVEDYEGEDFRRLDEAIQEGITENGIVLAENIELDWYVTVAKFDYATKWLTKLVNNKYVVLSEQERRDISFMNDCYPVTVAIKEQMRDILG